MGDNTDVVLITFTEPANIPAYAEQRRLELPILVDPSRTAYRAFGLGRGSIARIYGRKAARRYVEIIRADGLRGLARPTEDTLQLGGDFVVDGDGVLVYGFWGAGPDDRPSVDDLVAGVRAMEG